MKYPNLAWMLSYHGIQQYRLAEALKVSEAMLCRKLAGRADFAPHEKERVAEFLGYTSAFLFAEMLPHPSVRTRPIQPQSTAIA